MPFELTPRQEKFCCEIALGHRPSEAYRRAGYTTKNSNVALSSAKNLLALPKIKNRINELKTQAADYAGVDASHVVGQLAKMAFADIHDFLDLSEDNLRLRTRFDGTVPSELNITRSPNGQITARVKIDRVPALQMLAKYLGMMDDRLLVQGKIETTHKEEKTIHVNFAQRLIREHPELIDDIFRFRDADRRGLGDNSGEDESNSLQEVREPEE